MRIINELCGIELNFEEDKVNVLVIEKQELMSIVVNDFWNQSNGGEGEFIIADNDNILNPNKILECIINPFSVDVNDKKILTAIYKQLTDDANLDYQEELLELNSRIVHTIDNLLEAEQYAFSLNLDLDVNGLLKLYNVKLDYEEERLIEKLINYIKLVHAICKKQIIVLVNMKTFFSSEEIEYLYEVSFYEKINLIMLETCSSEFISGEKITIIDSDNCFIMLESE